MSAELEFVGGAQGCVFCAATPKPKLGISICVVAT